MTTRSSRSRSRDRQQASSLNSPPNSPPNGANDLLVEELSKVLPKDLSFEVYHLSTPPTVTEALYYPPAQPATLQPKTSPESATREPRPTKPLTTYCEKHFIALSTNPTKNRKESQGQVLILALEIYIFTTSFSTTIFVAKADSTGYLTLLELPKGTPSPIREVTAAFVAFLVATRRRPAKQLVVNLFARSQSQYLFPGSVKNPGKHILDDRGLVKWWCRVLHSLLDGKHDATSKSKALEGWDRVHGYIVVPGLDDYETRFFLPRSDNTSTSWTLGHPLERISPYSADPIAYGENIPPRCLIPTFPDDPKARFVGELEEATPARLKLTSGWRSPKTLEQFWDMMAFRQECSSGQLTGFIWVVFDPKPPTKQTPRPNAAAIPTPNPSFSAADQADSTTTKLATIPNDTIPKTRTTDTRPEKSRTKKQQKLTGAIVPRKPRIKTHNRTKFPRHTSTPHYFWPEPGRGQVVLEDSGYTRAVELLLHLEFGRLDAAIKSTARWVGEVNVGAKWGRLVVGRRDAVPLQSTTAAGAGINNLSAIIRRKRPAEEQEREDDAVASAVATAPAAAAAAVNTLGAGLIRKKAKTTAPDEDAAAPATSAEPGVNVLGAGLVRKKARPAE